MNTKEYNQLHEESQEFISKAQALMSRFDELGLTPSIKRPELELEYKTILFTKLLQSSKDLKARMELFRSEDSKKKLIDQTIDLTGYDVIDELMKEIEDYIDARPYGISGFMSAERFLVHYKADFHDAFGKKVRDVTNTDLYLKFKHLEEVINELTKEIPYLTDDTRMMPELSKAFKQAYGSRHVELQENYIIQLIDWKKNQDEKIAQWNKDQEELKRHNEELEARQKAAFQAATKGNDRY